MASADFEFQPSYCDRCSVKSLLFGYRLMICVNRRLLGPATAEKTPRTGHIWSGRTPPGGTCPEQCHTCSRREVRNRRPDLCRNYCLCGSCPWYWNLYPQSLVRSYNCSTQLVPSCSVGLPFCTMCRLDCSARTETLCRWKHNLCEPRTVFTNSSKKWQRMRNFLSGLCRDFMHDLWPLPLPLHPWRHCAKPLPVPLPNTQCDEITTAEPRNQASVNVPCLLPRL